MTNVTFLTTATTATLEEKEVRLALTHLREHIAQRVRDARSQLKMSRRVLAQTSGVSQRYLAQLESADGNISIALLLRVAMALNLPLDGLLKAPNPMVDDLTKLSMLYQKADPQLRFAVMEQLESKQITDERANRICLVGLRGAGKSTIGALAAESIGVPFLELNNEIETMAGMPVGEIIGLYGQAGYRKLEQEALLQVSRSHDRILMAAAGGVVEDTETHNMLMSRFHTIWLRASPDEHMARVRDQGDERPMAGHPAAMEQLKRLLADRESAYSRADAQLFTSGLTLSQSLERLIELIEAKKYLS